MLHVENKHVSPQSVRSIEGGQTAGPFFVKSLMHGESMTLLEVRMQAGVASPVHAHAHESVIYVVNGKLSTTIGIETFVLGSGDVCRHPCGVGHSVAALQETVFIEIKSPPPELKTVLGVADEGI